MPTVTMLRVQLLNPDGQSQFHTFTKAEVMIGRKPDSDLVLGGKDVSGTHACLQVEGERVLLFDLQSTNGTFVNGQRLTVPTALGPDDEVVISEFTLRASLADAHPTSLPEPVPAPPRQVSTQPGPQPTATPSEPEPTPPPKVREPVDGPPLARTAPPRSPLVSLEADDLPPIVARPRQADPPPPQPAPPQPAPPQPAPRAAPRNTPPQPVLAASDLAHAWQDPTVRRIFIMGLQRVEVERDGVRLPLLPHSFKSADDLAAQLTALCGSRICGAISERVLADGTLIQATETSEYGPYLVITRPRLLRIASLDALVDDGVLPIAAAELLSACTRARLPVLLAALPGATAAPLIAALLAAAAGPTALVRGLPAPLLAPLGCTAFDASHGEGRMAAAVRLALAGDVQWLGVDEPEAPALDECAWAAASGCGVVVGLRAESLAHALRRARAFGAGADGPAISYALVALLAPSTEANVGRLNLRWLGELRPGDGPNNVHELFTTERRGKLIVTAVPQLLADLGHRGIHLSPELFTLA